MRSNWSIRADKNWAYQFYASEDVIGYPMDWGYLLDHEPDSIEKEWITGMAERAFGLARFKHRPPSKIWMP